MTVVSEETEMGPFDGPPRGNTCQRCSERPADEWWTGEGGMMGALHGCYQAWCMRCIVEVQLVYARRAAETVAELEKKLAELGGKHVLSMNYALCYACGAAAAIPVGAEVPFGWSKNPTGNACSKKCAASEPTCSWTWGVGKSQPMTTRCGRKDVVLDDGFWRCPKHTAEARGYKKP